MQIEYVPLSEIDEPVDPARLIIDQGPLQELIDSIQKRGLLQPILLKRSRDRYEIEAGHRRFLSMQQLNWDSAPCIILGDVEEKDMHIERAHENLVRENLSVIDEAKMVNTLVNESGRGIEETSYLINRTPAWIETRLDLLSYPDDLIAALSSEQINLAVARELSKCKNEEYRAKLLEYVMDTGAKSKTVKQWVNDSNLEEFSEAIEQSRITGIVQQIDLGPTFMHCGICNNKFSTEQLRHIFLCTTCQDGVSQIRAQCIKEANQEPQMPE